MFTMKTTIHSYLFVEDDNLFIFVRGRRQSLYICFWETTIPSYLVVEDDNPFIFVYGRRQSLYICLWKTKIPTYLVVEDDNPFICIGVRAFLKTSLKHLISKNSRD